jgi:hypothetical protein
MGLNYFSSFLISVFRTLATKILQEEPNRPIVLIDNKFRHKFTEHIVEPRIGLGGRSNVDMVSRLYLFANAPYFSSHVIEREGDFYSFVESSVVHSLNLGQVKPSYLGKIALFLNSLK